MGRTARTRRTPYLPPVEKIELPNRTPPWRWALVILLLVGGVALIAHSLLSLLSADSGWNEIEANATEDLSCASEFVLFYNLGAGDVPAPAEGKALTALYTQAAVEAYQLFTNDLGYYGVHNVYYLNRHPNEVVEVDGALYGAFEQITRHGDRTLYLAPVYEAYNGLFSCQDDALTADFDPYQNDSLRAYFATVASYAADPEMVDLRLLGDGQVELHVSDAYLAYAQAEEVTSFIDFYWMKNAFIADYLADALAAGGYTFGSLSSRDGFVRCLDASSGTPYSLNLYARSERTVYPAAVMQYSGARAICSLRNYPVSNFDATRYYTLADGEIRTAYLDVRDGLCKSALDELTVTAANGTCAELLLSAIPVYIADAFDADALAALPGQGVDILYCSGRTVLCSDPSLTLTNLFQSDEVRYEAAYL